MILNKTNVPYLTDDGVQFLPETGIDKVYLRGIPNYRLVSM